MSPAEPAVFPAYIRPIQWARSHFLDASKWHCLPVQRRAFTPAGAWVVLQSVRGKASDITADADRVVRSSVLLAGVNPAQTTRGDPIVHYRPSLNDLAFRFPVPAASAKSRMVHATGSYRAC